MPNYVNIMREVAQGLGVKVLPTAETAISTVKAFEPKGASRFVQEAIEMTPIAQVIKQGASNPEAYLAAKAAATRSEGMLPRAIGVAEKGEKAPPLVDLVRELAKGAKYDGAVVAKKDGMTMVNFEEGLFKGTQAMVDDSTILIERGARLTEHSLAPQAGFQKMTNRFVNG